MVLCKKGVVEFCGPRSHFRPGFFCIKPLGFTVQNLQHVEQTPLGPSREHVRILGSVGVAETDVVRNRLQPKPTGRNRPAETDRPKPSGRNRPAETDPPGRNRPAQTIFETARPKPTLAETVLCHPNPSLKLGLGKFKFPIGNRRPTKI